VYVRIVNDAVLIGQRAIGNIHGTSNNMLPYFLPKQKKDGLANVYSLEPFQNTKKWHIMMRKTSARF
jgi:hypothetical protein